MSKKVLDGKGVCRISLLALFLLLSFTQMAHCQNEDKLNYPLSRKVDQADQYFGVSVEDPYQWLEEDVRKSDEVKAWVAAQNKLAFSYIEKLPYREEIEQRLTKLWDYEKFGPPRKRGGRYYFSKNDGLQNQSVVYQMDTLESEPTVLIDPNKWSKDGTVALGGFCLLYTSDAADE